MNCLGIPVVYDPDLKVIHRSRGLKRVVVGISESRGLWPFKRIIVGPGLRAFPEREQAAILLHEAGHCKMFHLEKRILRAFTAFFRPSLILAYCRAQELSADEFAARCGYALDLARVFERLSTYEGGIWHPSANDRIARLLAWHSKE